MSNETPSDKTLRSATATESPITLLEKWIEPPLRTPAPSFMDEPQRRIERQGVLKDMSPLGTPPSKKKAEEARKINMAQRTGDRSRSASSLPQRVVTPDATVDLTGARVRSQPPEPSHIDPTTPRAQLVLKAVTTTPSGVQKQGIPSTLPSSVVASPAKDERSLLAMDRVIRSAVEEALDLGHICTAFAIRTLYNSHRTNQGITFLLECVFRRRADELQLREFTSLMRHKKREGRKGGKARRYFEENDNTIPAPSLFPSSWSIQSSPAKRSAPESANNRAAAMSPYDEDESHVSKRHKSNNYHSNATSDMHSKSNGGPLANGTSRPGSRSRTRSHSTGSTLSSLDEELLNLAQSPANMERSQARPKANSSTNISTRARGEPRAASTANASASAHARDQPMALHSTSTQKLHASSSAPSPSPAVLSVRSGAHSPSRPFAIAQAAPATEPDVSGSMLPAAYSEPAVVSQPQPSQHPAHLKLFKKAAAGTPPNPDDDRDLQLRERKTTTRAITNITTGFKQSFARTHLDRDKIIESESDADSAVPVTRGPASGPTLRLRSHRKVNDESDDLSSPTILSFSNDGVPDSSFNSRAGTPNTLTRASKRPKGSGGLRIKTSPMKKKTGPSAGLPRASGERNSPVGNGAMNGQDDNDDYCSACGGNGDLVCCDGCTRSFHFRCVDPPMVEGSLPDSWYCNICKTSRDPQPNNDISSFGRLGFNLNRKNPTAFHLPKEVRDYFENVRTGTEGEYEDGVVVKPKRGIANEEPPDYLRLKDNKGNFILCFHCHLGAAGGKPIIPCSFCGLNWHLDCLDPPMANPPVLGKMWRCPCHVDGMLYTLPEALGPAHRFRKIKNASIIRPTIPRGSKNLGHIEVELEDSDSDDDTGFVNRTEFGKIYKLPEKGIKLDFLSRARVHRRLIASQEAPNANARQEAKEELKPHSLNHRQAALNLVYLATEARVDRNPENLVEVLLAEAPRDVIELLARGDLENMGSNTANGIRESISKQSLIAMKIWIDDRLSSMDVDEDSSTLIEETSNDQPPHPVIQNTETKTEEVQMT